jgi:hypothetical protein
MTSDKKTFQLLNRVRYAITVCVSIWAAEIRPLPSTMGCHSGESQNPGFFTPKQNGRPKSPAHLLSLLLASSRVCAPGAAKVMV